MKKSCSICQYWRRPDVMPGLNFSKDWCSNSNSLHFLAETLDSCSCREFYRRGKKAPLWMRVINNALAQVNK